VRRERWRPGPEGPRGCRAPAPQPQFPMTRLQKPRRGPQAPLPGFTSPPPARREARGSVCLGFQRGWARRRFRPWGWVDEGVTTGRPAPAQAPPLHACAGTGGGAARYPAAPRSTPSPARGGIRFRPRWGPSGPRQPPLRSLGARSAGPGGGASSGRRGSSGRKCALPPRPEHSDPLPSDARGRIGMAGERGVPWGGGASRARCAGASPRSGVGWGLPGSLSVFLAGADGR